MDARKEVTEQLCLKYRRSRKKEKGKILDNTVELTGWHRVHAAGVLSGRIPIPKGKKQNNRRKNAVHPSKRRGRKPKYTMAHKEVLKKVWAVMDFSSSVRIKAGMKDVLASMERSGHLSLDEAMRKDMLTMSASTMDRLLEFDRKGMVLKGRATTKPGTLLKSQIPVRRGSDWDDAKAGFVEVDLVAHCGRSAKGEFISTLNMTDVKTTWTHPHAIINKARVHTVNAIKHIKACLPFDLLGIDSDNGSEFINDHLLAFCKDNNILFTRGRPNKKNDGCFIEEKNWSVVRRFTAYYRFEGKETLDVLNMLNDLLVLYINYFMPSQKLISATRDGAHVSRKHDKGFTPYRRIMADKDIPKETKDKLTAVFEDLDVLELRRQIAHLQDALKRLAVPD
jgi:hypothetical protein